MTFRNHLTLSAVVAFLAISCSHSISELQKGFENPPHEARPQVWWHWMDGNITKDGIRKDLLWMKESGIGGFHHFDAGVGMTPVVEDRLIYMDNGWKDAFRYAMVLADSLGLEVTIASAPGWSCTGGPWVDPGDAMKKLVWRELTLQGDHHFEGDLPQGFSVSGAFQNIPIKSDVPSYYEDIAVIAVKLPAGEKTLQQLGATVRASSEGYTVNQLTNEDLNDGVSIRNDSKGKSWIEYSFPEPVTFCAVSVTDGRTRKQWANTKASLTTVLECSDDGQIYTKVAEIPASGITRSTIDFAPITARHFRITAVQGNIISEFKLYTVPRINHAEEKAGFVAPHDLADFPTPSYDYGAVTDIIDITDRFDGRRLIWDVPEGEWKVIRFGFSLTGKTNHPAPREATGLEVDKMDPDAWTAYFRHYFDMYKEASGGLMGSRGIRYVLTDSYEAEQATWTPAMAEEFLKRRGYDLTRWLPSLTGIIIDSPQATEQFLWDWRTTIGELLAENYDLLTDIAVNEYGLKGRYTESHENGRVYVVDGMDVKRTAAIPMAACWMPNRYHGSTPVMSQADIRESASVAHIYGQNIVAGESLTAVGRDGKAWSYDPAQLKSVADLEMASGLNRFVIHESAHQPLDSIAPGLGLMIFGQWFNRLDTWAGNAKAWTDYLARSCYMLQQGQAVADILVYYGEDTNATAQFGSGLPQIPEGYNYDFASPDVLLNMISVKDGQLVTGTGMKYKVLLIAGQTSYMSETIRERLEQLESEGACICRSYDELAASLPAPDCTGTAEIRFVHRVLPDKTEIYWINKPSSDYSTVTVSLRTEHMKPHIWHPEDGRTEEAVYRCEEGRTIVDIDMVPDDAVFIVLAGKGKRSNARKEQVPSSETIVDGPWTVNFEKGKGAPEETVFDTLAPYTDSDVFGIKYFSGTAIYTNTFNIGKTTEKAILHLGNVHNLATVKVNGIECGTLWKEPFDADITGAVRNGENRIEIAVTNLWPNRLIGNLQPDCKKKIGFCYEPSFFSADMPLSHDGLEGPVSVELY